MSEVARTVSVIETVAMIAVTTAATTVEIVTRTVAAHVHRPAAIDPETVTQTATGGTETTIGTDVAVPRHAVQAHRVRLRTQLQIDCATA
jgi:hypothetical protein